MSDRALAHAPMTTQRPSCVLVTVPLRYNRMKRESRRERRRRGRERGGEEKSPQRPHLPSTAQRLSCVFSYHNCMEGRGRGEVRHERRRLECHGGDGATAILRLGDGLAVLQLYETREEMRGGEKRRRGEGLLHAALTTVQRLPSSGDGHAALQPCEQGSRREES